jgi:uncharacterized membrane protein
MRTYVWLDLGGRMSQLSSFLSGAIMGLCFVASLFFARFWSRTQDRLFAVFSLSFFLLGFERCALFVVGANDETRTWVYLIRFVAFAVLVVGIVDKNRANSGRERRQ